MSIVNELKRGFVEVAAKREGHTAMRRRQRIPYVIHQTFKSRIVPEGMHGAIKSWIDANPEYDHRFFDDNAIVEFISSELDCSHFNFDRKDALKAFAAIKPGAGKADMFRYLLMYQFGGVYMDVDTVCHKPLREFIGADDVVVSGIGNRGDLHQWGLIYSERHPFMKRAGEIAVHNILKKSFIKGFENSLEGLCGPPCLDQAIKEVVGAPPDSAFIPGIMTQKQGDDVSYVRLMEGDFFGGNVGFKYKGYLQDLAMCDVKYWVKDELFNS